MQNYFFCLQSLFWNSFTFDLLQLDHAMPGSRLILSYSLLCKHCILSCWCVVSFTLEMPWVGLYRGFILSLSLCYPFSSYETLKMPPTSYFWIFFCWEWSILFSFLFWESRSLITFFGCIHTAHEIIKGLLHLPYSSFTLVIWSPSSSLCLLGFSCLFTLPSLFAFCAFIWH